MTKTDSIECYENMITSLGLKARNGQRDLVEQISNHLETQDVKVAVAEAGTGTGKSIAYLCATAPIAVKSKKKVIVSTGTVQLQSQLMDKDIPIFIDNSGLKITAELAKGRGRYLCPRKVESNLEKGASHELIQLSEQYNNGSWSGDVDEITYPTIWPSISANRFDCPGIQCPKSDACPFIKARKRLKDADLIISNHDLTLADLSSGGNILSMPEDTIYVFDEAHHLPDKALNMFSFNFTIKEGAEWLEGLTSFLGNHDLVMSKVKEGVIESIMSEINVYLSLLNNISEILNTLEYDQKTQNDQTFLHKRFENGVLPINLSLQATQCRTIWSKIYKATQTLNEEIKEINKAASDHMAGVFEDIGPLIAKCERAYNFWLGFAHQDNPHQTPKARWVQCNSNGSYTLYCAAINASKALNSFLFSKAHAVVMTSATLLVDQSFESFKRQSGIPENSLLLKVDSPFNYPDVATLTIPNSNVDPRHFGKHTKLVSDYVAKEINLNEGTLVIFASYKQMNAVYESLPDHIVDFVLLQNSTSKKEIIERHKLRIDDGMGSVIFGLQQSWGEGVDLAGKYASNVIISKLNFSVPDDPISEAQSEYVKSQGGNPFMDICVPEATIKLVQTVGRLIRTESDTGNVTVLDNRILTKGYGKVMLNSLPPLKLVK